MEAKDGHRGQLDFAFAHTPPPEGAERAEVDSAGTGGADRVMESAVNSAGTGGVGSAVAGVMDSAVAGVGNSGNAIMLGGRDVPYTLRRSPRRRTVGLAVEPEQGLVVYCPQRFALKRLEELLRLKARWILEKTSRAEGVRARRRSYRWAEGEALPFLGEHLPLTIVSAGRVCSLRAEAGRLVLALPPQLSEQRDPAALRPHMLAAYRSAALDALQPRVAYWQTLLDLAAKQVRVRDQKRRWGSCSAAGVLNFNWRLVLMPPRVLDYVVLHEVCHLRHGNHSARFWGLLARHMPDYAQQKAWLREHGSSLYF